MIASSLESNKNADWNCEGILFNQRALGALSVAPIDKWKGVYVALLKKTAPTKSKGIVIDSLVIYALINSESEEEETVLGERMLLSYLLLPTYYQEG